MPAKTFTVSLTEDQLIAVQDAVEWFQENARGMDDEDDPRGTAYWDEIQGALDKGWEQRERFA